MTDVTTEYPNIAAALASVQAQLPEIKKTKTAKVRMKAGGEYSYKYADLGDINPQILPLLGKAGLAWVTKPTYDSEGFSLHYKLKHSVSGEAEEGTYPLPDPTKHTPQEIGSALTYARRYALCCVTGIAPDEDVDAREAPTAAKREPKAQPLAERLKAKAEPEPELTKMQEEVQALREDLKPEQIKELAEWWQDEAKLPRVKQLSDEQAQTAIDRINIILEGTAK